MNKLFNHFTKTILLLIVFSSFVFAQNADWQQQTIDFTGSYEYSNVVEVEYMPTAYSLNQNYPNPFNPTTTISFTLPTENNVKLSVYNLLGEEVATLVNGVITAGNHRVDFNAAELSSGMYLYKLEAGNFSATKKLVLMK